MQKYEKINPKKCCNTKEISQLHSADFISVLVPAVADVISPCLVREEDTTKQSACGIVSYLGKITTPSLGISVILEAYSFHTKIS